MWIVVETILWKHIYIYSKLILKYYTVDHKNDKILDKFPNNVLKLRPEYDKESGLSKYVLDKNYRKQDSDEFFYFSRQVVPCVNAMFNSYKTKCRSMKLSKVFTINDESYTLALLINEYDSYHYVPKKRVKQIKSWWKETAKAFHKQCKWEQVGLEQTWTYNFRRINKASGRKGWRIWKTDWWICVLMTLVGW